MFDVLTTFGFKSSFISWIKTLYNSITSRISNNGWISEPFPIKRGVRQACPLSALLFILVVEVLATKIRSDSSLQGIQVKQNQIKITQLADDTTLYLKIEPEISKALNIMMNLAKYLA